MSAAPPIDITVDISPAVHRHAGLGRYAHELLTALCAVDGHNRYAALYYAPRGTERPDPPLDRLPARALRLSAKPWRMSVLLAHFSGVGMDGWLRPGQVFHATDHLLPRLRQTGTVFTVHDLIYLFYPEYHLPLNRWYLTLMMPRFLKRADAIIAVSENTRRDVTRLMGIPAEKVVVIHEGVNPAYRPVREADRLAAVCARYRVPAGALLYFSTIEPRKNLAGLLDAYASLVARRPALPDLVVAGRKGWLFEPIFEQVQRLGLAERVHFTGWVDEADAPALLSAAAAVVYPSLYEGFGLPVLEAMACGTPVVTSTASSLPEIAGEAALLVDPRDAAGLAQAIERLLDDSALQAELRGRGLARAAQFTWDATARQTLAVYEQVQRGRHARGV